MRLFVVVFGLSCAVFSENKDQNTNREENLTQDSTSETTDSSSTDSGIEHEQSTDSDGDGYSELEGDCDDNNNTIHPDAEEVWYDGIDQNCDGANDYDADQDGAESSEHGGEDCNDFDASINGSASEVWYDGIDQNCDGANDYDADQDGMDDRAVDLSLTPQYVMTLHPVGEKSGNALQGLAVEFDTRTVWMTIDTSSLSGNALLNRLSLESGTSQYCEPYNASNIELGHAQDLSLERRASGQLYLWTGSDSDRGVSRINPELKTIDVVSDLLPIGWSHTTPTIGLNNQWLAVRGSEDADPAANDWIRIYDKADIEAAFGTPSGPSPLYAFNVDSTQRVSDMWFQGIALDEELGLVYALTGNNTLEQTEKLLYVYDLDGNIIQQKMISMDLSLADSMGSKYEPEGLSLVKDPTTGQRYLYFSMMFGGSGSNIKRLYVIGAESVDFGGGGAEEPMNWLLRYNSNSGAVSIKSLYGDGALGCDVKDSTWTTGWTGFLSYYSGGEPFLFIQKEQEGTTYIHPLTWDGGLESKTKDSDWSSGWDTFESWRYGSSTYLFHYKSSTGLARVLELTASGNTDCCSEDEDWDVGWMVTVYEQSGQDYLLRYNQANGQAQILELGAGTYGSQAYSEYWTNEVYTQMVTADIGGSSILLRLGESGLLEVVELDGNGLPVGVIDTLNVGQSWSELFTFYSEGMSRVYLYDESSGATEIYGLDVGGQLSGPLNSTNQASGWTSFLRFETIMP